MSMETKKKFHQNPCITIQKRKANYVMSLFEDFSLEIKNMI